MKNVVLLIVLVGVLFSCQKDESKNEVNGGIQTITIDEIKSLLPLSESLSKKYAVFYNQNGQELIFDFSIREELIEKKIGSESYFAESISGNYSIDGLSEYSLYFLGSGNYSNSIESNLFVTAGINQIIEPVITLLTIDEEGSAVLGLAYNDLQLLDKEFHDVYSNIIVEEFNAFSEIYYTADIGVVGFRDKQDELYVFKEYRD